MTVRKNDINDFIEIKGNPLSKVGVFEYSGKQIDPERRKSDIDPNGIYKVYRPREELDNEECINSFKLLPWIDDHAMLGGEEGFTPPEKKGIQGVIGEEVYFEDVYLKGNIKIFSEKLKQLVKNGKKELSAGYKCVYDSMPGIYNGEKYDFVQRKIRGNHLALVDEGRSGHDVAVLDYFKFTFDSKGLEMFEKKTKEVKDETLSLETLSKKMDDLITAIVGRLDKLETSKTADEEGAEKKEEKIVTDEEGAEKKEEKIVTDEDTEKKAGEAKAMDAKLFKKMTERVEALEKNGFKLLIGEISKRDQLAANLSEHIGTFDHKEKTLSEVAKYGVEKLGLNCDSGEEIAVLNGFFKGRKLGIVSSYNQGSFAQDTNNVSGEPSSVDEYLNGGNK